MSPRLLKNLGECVSDTFIVGKAMFLGVYEPIRDAIRDCNDYRKKMREDLDYARLEEKWDRQRRY